MNGGGQQRPVGTTLMRRIVPNRGLLIGGFHTEARGGLFLMSTQTIATLPNRLKGFVDADSRSQAGGVSPVREIRGRLNR